MIFVLGFYKEHKDVVIFFLFGLNFNEKFIGNWPIGRPKEKLNSGNDQQNTNNNHQKMDKQCLLLHGTIYNLYYITSVN